MSEDPLPDDVPLFDSDTVLGAALTAGAFALLLVGLLFAMAFAADLWMRGAAL